MRTKWAGAAVAAGVGLWGWIGVAEAAIFTDRAAFEAALSSYSTEQFSAPAGSYNAYGGVFIDTTFGIIDQTSSITTVDPTYYPPYYQFNSGAVLNAEAGNLVFVLTPGIDAIGFDFANPSTYDSFNHMITIDGLSFGGYSQPTFAFFGIITPGSSPNVTVDFDGGLGIIDNVTTGVSGILPVPLPSALPMFGAALLSLGGLAFTRRRGVLITPPAS